MRNLIVCILLFFFTSCSSKNVNNYEEFPTSIPREAYLKIRIGYTPEICLKGKCVRPFKALNYGVASAFSIKSAGEDMYALTAAHVCEDPKDLPVPPRTKPVTVLTAYSMSGSEHKVEILKQDPTTDLCLIRVVRLSTPVLPIAVDSPKIGSRVYSMQGPLGLSRKNMVPLFTGFYSGKYRDGSMEEFYTMPADGGSSGSPILDKHGSVIGVISMAGARFKHFILSPSVSSIVLFLADTQVSLGMDDGRYGVCLGVDN